MRSLVLLVCSIATLALTACTSTSTTMLASDRAIVTTRGNAFTSPERVTRDLMIDVATLAQSGGFEWFQIEGSRDVTQSGALVTPAEGSSSFGCNAYNCSGSSAYRGADVTPYTKPGMQVMVRFGRGPRPQNAFNAAEVLALNPSR